MATITPSSSVDDAVAWLITLPGKFDQYESAMRDNAIDGAKLHAITTDELLDLLEVKSFGHKLLIKKHHGLLGKESIPQPSSAASADVPSVTSQLSNLAAQPYFQQAFATGDQASQKPKKPNRAASSSNLVGKRSSTTSLAQQSQDDGGMAPRSLSVLQLSPSNQLTQTTRNTDHIAQAVLHPSETRNWLVVQKGYLGHKKKRLTKKLNLVYCILKVQPQAYTACIEEYEGRQMVVSHKLTGTSTALATKTAADFQVKVQNQFDMETLLYTAEKGHEAEAASWVMAIQTVTLALSKMDVGLVTGMSMSQSATSSSSPSAEAAAILEDATAADRLGAETVRMTSDDGSEQRADQQKAALLKTQYMSKVTSKFHFLEE
eukprot:TRINITY_DN5311_c9_g1_i2.p1 TRINITY_DN5311_c9_g1~~TRINITY_DN5311_c9_g1_i2.p1  ORF type:complete len:430 (+),score=87.13 TRINITY_DN5311_c9_g1_i2:163-1290(+)